MNLADLKLGELGDMSNIVSAWTWGLFATPILSASEQNPTFYPASE